MLLLTIAKFHQNNNGLWKRSLGRLHKIKSNQKKKSGIKKKSSKLTFCLLQSSKSKLISAYELTNDENVVYWFRFESKKNSQMLQTKHAHKYQKPSNIRLSTISRQYFNWKFIRTDCRYSPNENARPRWRSSHAPIISLSIEIETALLRFFRSAKSRKSAFEERKRNEAKCEKNERRKK